MLGSREPEIYGNLSYEELISYTKDKLVDYSIKLEWFQSNVEGEIVDRIQKISQTNAIDRLIINPAAYSHYSVAILDALKLLAIPIIEVHISNTNCREEYRNVKITAKAASSILEGFGKDTYYLAILSQL